MKWFFNSSRWTFMEGFLTGGGLIAIGLLLHLCVGPVVWEAFAWPVNGIVMGGLVLMIVLMFSLRKKVTAFRFLGTYQAAIPAMVYAVLLTVVMGLTRQDGRGSWLSDMLRRLNQIVRRKSAKGFWQNVAFVLNHVGLFIALTTATLGNADMQRVRMTTFVGEREWRALDRDGAVKMMPLGIELKRFIMETYDDGKRRFAFRPRRARRLRPSST
jgi:hypothetical protein